jgi:23S rRNA (adenine2503-C2)-methyltransferase
VAKTNYNNSNPLEKRKGKKCAFDSFSFSSVLPLQNGKNGTKEYPSLNLQELEQWFESIGEKKFRTKQVYEWIWQKGSGSFADMSNLSKAVAPAAWRSIHLPALTTDLMQQSTDWNDQTPFQNMGWDISLKGFYTDSIEIYACVSSQIGCSLSCKFCATGYLEKTEES